MSTNFVAEQGSDVWQKLLSECRRRLSTKNGSNQLVAHVAAVAKKVQVTMISVSKLFLNNKLKNL
jgi:hypothetical protein